MATYFFNAKGPTRINSNREKCALLDRQISKKERIIKNLKYHLRNARKQTRDEWIEYLEWLLDFEKQQLETLRNQRNHLFRLITGCQYTN